MSKYYYCDICGRKVNKKIRLGGYTLCSKHMHQLFTYGKFLDKNPRTNNDLNDFVIEGDIAKFNLYNQKNEKVGEFIIDKEDVEKVRYHKWRFSHTHVVTGQPSKKQQRELSHIILNIPKDQDETVVDHINGDATDNRRKNLRICTQGDNTLNKSFISNNTTGYIGVSYDSKRNRYDPEVRKDRKRAHLGYYKDLKKAVYARYLGEGIVFKEFCNEEEHLKKFLFTKDLPENIKEKIFDKVKSQLKKYELWQ